MIIYRKLKPFILIILVAISGFVYKQNDDTFTKLLDNFVKVNKLHQEKIYVHIDNAHSSGGQEIWFKLYLVNANDHTPVPKENIAYVDIIDENNKTIVHQRLKVKDGVASGSLQIPQLQEEGVFTFVAYTNWMRNFSPDRFFTSRIQLHKPDSMKSGIKENDHGIELFFFPEGGYLISGLESRVGFKAINKKGKGIKVTGEIQSYNGEKISFSSSSLGIGTFNILPEGDSLYAKVKVENDTSLYTFPLPTPLAEGIVLRVNNDEEKNLEIHVNEKSTRSNLTGQTNVHMVIHSKGKIHLNDKVDLHNGSATYSLSKEKLPHGLQIVTLLSSSGHPIAERLFFIDKNKNLQIKVGGLKKNYLPREKITLEVQVLDKQDKPQKGHFSLAVNEKSSLPANSEFSENIYSYLLLSSEVKGEIENPHYYFKKQNSKALDELLLTQGWRRFTWKEFQNEKLLKTPYEVEESISLEGKVFYKNSTTEVNSASVIMAIADDEMNYKFDVTNIDGLFYFDELSFNGNKEIYLMARDKFSAASDLTINVDTIPSQVHNYRFSEKILDELSGETKRQSVFKRLIDKEFKESIYDSMKSNQVTNTEKPRAQKLDFEIDDNVDLEDYVSFSSMAEVFKEIVPGVSIKEKNGLYKLNVLNRVTKYYFKEEPLYLLDGIPIDKADVLMDLDPSTVQTITVSRPPQNFYDFGTMGEKGVIAVFTEHPKNNLSTVKDAIKINFQGLEAEKEFYSPNHENGEYPRNVPDFRSLLYWNPNIITDENGNATITFFASDDVSRYKISIEGLTQSGIPGAEFFEFQTHPHLK